MVQYLWYLQMSFALIPVLVYPILFCKCACFVNVYISGYTAPDLDYLKTHDLFTAAKTLEERSETVVLDGAMSKRSGALLVFKLITGEKVCMNINYSCVIS